ncbi:hypothetical protein HK405_007670, partial [Cladochytrium tenue]
MVNIVLVLFSVLFAILIVVAAIYFLVYFQHPDDKWIAWLPKGIVVLGLSLSAYNIFLLPLDVANQSGQLVATGQLPMSTITLSFYITTVFLVVVGVPFTVFYYEGVDDNDESDTKKSHASQIGYALKWLMPTLFFVGAIIGVMYWQVGYAVIPTTRVVGAFTTGFDVSKDYCALASSGSSVCTLQYGNRYPWVSGLVYTVALVTLAGWLIFSVFGGVGLVCLPYDLFQEFQHRPKPITAAEYAEQKKAIGQQAELLMEVGTGLTEELRDSQRSGKSRFDKRFRKLRLREAEFRKDVLILEFHYRRLEECYKMQGVNILLQYFKLVGSAILSLLWIVHIILYLLPYILKSTPYSQFLSTFFESVSPIPFIGTALYALFAFYLLLCVVKGNTKLGMRLFFFAIHPLRIGETMMNSLVFNTGIILLSSLAVAQFCTLAFAPYAKYTASNSLFGVQFQNLQGVQYVYDAFVFLLIGSAGLSVAYNIYRPYNKQRENR